MIIKNFISTILYCVILSLIPQFVVSNDSKKGINSPKAFNSFAYDIVFESNNDFVKYKNNSISKIRQLAVCNSNIDSLVGMLESIKQIESINLIACYGSKYVQAFKEIEAKNTVRNIVLENVNMEDFSEFFSIFDSLESIEINNCNLTSLNFLDRYKSTLKHLRLKNITVDSIANHLQNLIALQDLLLINLNEDREISKFLDLSNLTLLKYLYLEANIKRVNLKNCCNLKSLSLFLNYPSEKEEFLTIDKCTYLESFDIGCQIPRNSSLIRNYLNSSNIHYDSIVDMGLTGLGYREIPHFLLNCKRLERLSIRRNKIKNIDFDWDELKYLTNIDFRDNLIDSIPQSIKKYMNRKILLELEGNFIDSDEMEKYNSKY